MSVEQNKQIVRRFFQHTSEGDIQKAFELLAPDATWWFPSDQPEGITMTKEQMAGTTDTFMKLFKQKPTFTMVSLTAEDDRVSMEQIGRDGLTHGGNTYNNNYHMFFRLEDGLICEIKEYMNPLAAVPLMGEMQAGQQPAEA